MPLSGIEYAPELHWRLAAAWAGYKWEDFCSLDGDDQAAVVASYDCKVRIDAVIAYEQMKRAIAESRRHG